MEVYVELALAENFCMDFTLLYAAKIGSKNIAGFKRIAVAAVLGACFAVVMPLSNIGGAWSAVLKILSGLLICFIAGRFKSIKDYLKFAGVFLALTALLGGALIAVFSIAGWEYSSGQGFILSSVPIGIPLFFALLLIILARRIAAKLKRADRAEVSLRIMNGDKEAALTGFFDSGNKVYSGGEPVSIVPQKTAEKITDINRIKSGVKIHTVTGSKTIKVFTVDKLVINQSGKIKEFKNVKLGVSPNEIDCAVLHSDFLE